MIRNILSLKKSLATIAIFILMFGLVGYSSETGHGTEGKTEGVIERRLGMDTRVNSELIGVNVVDGQAKLFGTVETLEEKAFATTIAGSVVGVQSVMNAITVKPDVSRDREIQNKIERAIDMAEMSTKNNISVRTVDGIVTLEGTVVRQRDKRLVSRTAQSVKGVREVENLLQVVNSNRTDEAIHKDVILYLLWSPLVDIDDFKLEVKNGVVSLRGSVEHLSYKDVLMIDIENIHGVKDVKVGKVVPKPLKAFSAQSKDNS